MADVTFITGNQNKAKYFAELVGAHIEHQPVDTPEIQSTNLAEIVEFKAKAAYEKIKKPVIIEDTGLVINSLGKLPGPFIKWFEKEIGLEKVCRLADISQDRSASAGAAFAFYDGNRLKIFESSLPGRIPKHPRGDEGFGWNPIFIPEDSELTLGEMDDETFKKYYVQVKPFDQVKKFLQEIGGDAGSRTPDLGNANAAL